MVKVSWINMQEKPIIWILDTSVFLNVLDVPGFNQDRSTVLAQFEERIKKEHTFLLPFSSILESGNHIAQLSSGSLRKKFAEKLNEQVSHSIEGNAPWRPLDFPDHNQLNTWMPSFPFAAQEGKGMGDFLILKQWEEQCGRFPEHIVKIWSLDNDLQGYECNH